MSEEVLLSPEGLRRLEQELEYLKTVRRREIAERIKQAREFGDISENSEYEDAKNEQAFVESRIAQLEHILRRARIVTEDEVDPNRVHIGSAVQVQDEEGAVYEYVIVGSTEGDPSNGRISYQSPVGRALFGRSVGETVEVSTPGGLVRLRILGVRRAG